MSIKKYIITKEEVLPKLNRLSLEVAETFYGDSAQLIIIGIKESGWILAQKIAELLQVHLEIPIELISISMNKHHPKEIILSKEINFDNKNVLIIDDVVNNGKTLLYSIKPLLQYHPKRIQTLVLVERMYKMFPVKPDFVGLSVSTTSQDHIEVEITDGEILGAYMI